MSYNLPSPEQSSTLTADERAEEAKRILDRLRTIDAEEAHWTDNAQIFVERKLADLDLWGHVSVTVKELFWLRDLNDRAD